MSRTPSRSSFWGIGMLPTSAMPGYPLGPQCFSTMMQLLSMSRLSSLTAWCIPSTDSKTTARPVCFISSGEAAEGLITAPSGQMLPRRIAMPESGLNGVSKGVITSWFQQAASLTFSQMGLPLAVSASLCSSPRSPSVRSTTGRPPA